MQFHASYDWVTEAFIITRQGSKNTGFLKENYLILLICFLGFLLHNGRYNCNLEFEGRWSGSITLNKIVKIKLKERRL